MNRVKLGEVADTCLGKMLDAKKNKGTLHPYLANVNVRWGFFDLDGLQEMPFEDGEAERYGLKSGDLVMCEGGEPGRCALWTDASTDMRFQKALHRIRAHKDVLDIRYLYYWFLYAGKRGMLDRYFTQTTIKHLVGEDLRTVELDLPDLERQKEIADVLSLIDAKIEANNKTIVELDSLARTVYDYMIGGPLDWPKGKLGDLGEIVSGATPPTAEESNYSNDGIAWITPDDLSGLSDNMFIGRGGRDITTEGLASCSARLMPGGTVVMSSRAPIGYIAISLSEFCTNQGCKSIVPDKAHGSWFVYYTLRRYMPLIESQGSGTTFKEVSKEALASIPIAVPPHKVVAGFNEHVEPLCACRRSLEAESAGLVALRDWLLPMLMNGQVTIDSEAR